MAKAENKAASRSGRTGRFVKVKRGHVNEIAVRTTLKKAGGSVVMTVPASVRHELNLAAGDAVNVTAEKGRVIVEPVRRLKPTLEDILLKCNPDAPLSAEEQAWRDDKPVGGEIW